MLRLLWAKFMADDVAVMASAVAFAILVATLPLLLLGVGVTGYVLSAMVDDPVEATVAVVVGLLPAGGGAAGLAGVVRDVVEGVVDQRSGFTIFGALLFIWLSTRLVGTLRVVLRDVFQVTKDRGMVHGKLFDVLVVIVAAFLIALNLGVTLAFAAAVRLGVRVLGLGAGVLYEVEWLLGHGLAFVSIWVLFLGLYRYLPAQRVPWRSAMMGATFAALAHELLKYGFSWYATSVADYTSAWGNLSTVGILFFWIYYEAVVFILGGQVAQVTTLAATPKDSTPTHEGATA